MVMQLLIATNLLLYLLSIFTWLVLPNQTTLNYSVSVFTVTLTAVLILKNKKKFDEKVKSNWFKKFTETVFYGFLLFAIFGLCHYLLYQFPKQIDFTKDKINTLAKQSVVLAKKIKQPLTVKIFNSKQKSAQIAPLLELYRLENSNIKIEIIDPDLNPAKLKAYNVSEIGAVILEMENRQERILEYSEKAITNALQRLIQNKKVKLLIPAGHRSKMMNDTSPQGLSRLGAYLKDEGFEVEYINLLEQAELPFKNVYSQVLFIIGPTLGFVDKELETIEDYLSKGGASILAIDPQMRGDIFENIRNLYADMRGITIANDFVVDSVKTIRESGGAIPVVDSFNEKHSITKDQKEKLIFPLSSSVQVDLNYKDGEVAPLALTSLFPASWADRSFQQVNSSEVSFDQGEDIKGPITLAASSNRGEKDKTIVLGTSLMFSNTYSNIRSNFDFLVRSLRWVVSQEDLIVFDKPEAKGERVAINRVSINVVFYFSVVFGPLLLLIFAAFMYRKRNSSGL